MSSTQVLRIESGLILHPANRPPATGVAIPYRTPEPWRRVEALTRLPIHLALSARRLADQCDIVWAGNEQIGLALSFMRLRTPLVVITHHIESPHKARLAKLSGAVHRWAGIGYVSDDCRRFLRDYFNVPDARLFQYESAKFLHRTTMPLQPTTGPIISVGVSKRDYRTLLFALRDLPDHATEFYPNSKFGDVLAQSLVANLPAWVRVVGRIEEAELLRRYERARFAVVTLENTTQTAAGVNAVLEAAAFGKAVIATRTGGMAAMVKDGETGILVPPYDASALREAMRYLWDEPDVAHRMGIAARRLAEERFDPAVVNLNIVRFLDNLREGARHA